MKYIITLLILLLTSFAQASYEVVGDLYLVSDEGKIYWYNGTNYVTFAADGSLSTNLGFTWPTAYGSSGQALTTSGSGGLSWSTVVLTQEQIDDYVYALVSDADSVHTLITITYDDPCNAYDFVVDNDLHNYSWTNVVDGDITNTLTSSTCTGNAATATALATARAIGGVNFDGTAAITPANITVADESADDTCFVSYFAAATGNLPPKTGTNLTFASSTGILTATELTLTDKLGVGGTNAVQSGGIYLEFTEVAPYGVLTSEDSMHLCSNCYYSSDDDDWHHIVNAGAAQMVMTQSGKVSYRIASAGAADAVVSWISPAAFYIHSDGNIGIDTKSPTERLHVVGNIKATGGIKCQIEAERILVGGVTLAPTTDRVAYYKLNDNLADTDVVNEDGTKGVLQGGENTEDKSVAGKTNLTPAFLLNGTDDYIVCGDQTSLDDEFEGDEEWSIAAWIKIDSGNTGTIVGRGRIVQGNQQYVIRVDSNVIKAAIGGAAYTGSAVVDDGNWHLICGVNRSVSGTLKFHLYVDCVQDGSAITSGGATLPATDTLIGARRDADNTDYAEVFDGTLDDVRFYGRALLEVEITDLYNNGDGTESAIEQSLLNAIGNTHNLSPSFIGISNKNLLIEGDLEVQTKIYTGEITVDSGGATEEIQLGNTENLRIYGALEQDLYLANYYHGGEINFIIETATTGLSRTFSITSDGDVVKWKSVNIGAFNFDDDHIITTGNLSDGTNSLTIANAKAAYDIIDGTTAITALHATTEATIEAAIDTLANLTSIQGQTVSLSGALTVESASLVNQDLTTDASPTFAGLTLSGNLILGSNSITGTSVDVSNAELQQLSNIGATTISAGQWGILGGLAATLTASELNYVDGVTSAIQTQFTGKASTALDNLASVAINTSLISDTTITDDIGSSAIKWQFGYFQAIACGANTATLTSDYGVLVGGDAANPLTMVGVEFRALSSTAYITSDVIADPANRMAYGYYSAVAPMGAANWHTVTGMYGHVYPIGDPYLTGSVVNCIGATVSAHTHPSLPATITNCYGLYIDDVSGGATSNWAIYDSTSVGSCLYSLRIGSTTAPTDKLEVVGISNLGDGGTTNYAEIKADGEINLHGTARVTKIATLDYYNATMGAGAENLLYGRDADATTDEYIIWAGYIPNDIASGSSFSIKFRWCPTVTNGDGVDRYVYWLGYHNHGGASGTIGAYTTVSAFSTTVPDTEVAKTIHETTFDTLTEGTDMNSGDFVTVRVIRDADNASDDYSADVFVFVNAYIEYISNKLGTAT